DIAGASAVVTGGASGLGEATVRRLAAAGAKVVILDRDTVKGEALAKELGPAAAFAPTDVTNAADVTAAVDLATSLAPLRIAVSCAGVGWAGRVVARDGTPHDLDLFSTVISINLIGTFNVLRLAASAIATTEPTDTGERGVIVNTASIAAYDGQIGQIAYAASKGGVVSLTLPAARDLASVGVRVCTIAPGLMDTPMLALLPEPQRRALGEGVPFPRRLGDPAGDYATLVEHIVRNSYLNGETIRLDGALRMPPK
ncbi:MAG TPA: SDR family NAD(P)-dependent oxidoreductase, partial [Acidimicrobiia bacterium]|nr:SDR family NAD(P)-dependent oxidoreductase [Acidimicrobiia bacterium]